MRQNRFFIGIMVFSNGFPQQYLIPAWRKPEWVKWIEARLPDQTEPPAYAVPLEGGTVTFENPLFE